jgi:hypothetical protein
MTFKDAVKCTVSIGEPVLIEEHPGLVDEWENFERDGPCAICKCWWLSAKRPRSARWNAYFAWECALALPFPAVARRNSRSASGQS